MILSRKCKIGLFLLLFLSLTLTLSLSLLSCYSPKTHTCIKDGRSYCVTSDWVPLDTWDAYYRRGINCMEGRCWEYAIEEFVQAVKRRPRDERNVRAYGMHFRDEYFPHREMGISYYHMGKLENAVSELQLSIEQTPSARAKYYLNQARRASILATGQDTAPPSIHIKSPQEGYLTNQTPIRIKGTVQDDQFVAAISVNGNPLFIELAEQEKDFNMPVDLEEGSNTIEILARDLIGREDRESVRVHLDQHGPLVIISPIREDQIRAPDPLILTALIYDRSGILSFKLNNKEVPRYGLDRLCLIEETIPLQPGIKSIPFMTQDRAGNRTKGEISLPFSPRRPSVALRLACSDPDNIFPFIGPLAMNYENKDISLDIIYPSKKRMETYGQDIFLEAEIDAKKGVKSFEIILEGEIRPDIETCRIEQTSYANEIMEYKKNKDRALFRKLEKQNYDPERGMKIIDDILKKNTFYYVNQRIPLCKDFTRQILTLIVEDNFGNLEHRQIHIQKYPREEIFQSEQKMQIAILPFDIGMDTPYYRDRQDYIYKTLSESFIIQDRFNLLEKENLPWDLIEKGCESGSICEKDEVLRIAETSSAEGIICGNVQKWLDGGVEIKASFMEAEMGETCIFHDVFSPRDTSDDLRTILSGLAMKFRDSFPIRNGEITEKYDRMIHVNIGSKKGILPCMRYNVFQDEKELLNRAIIKEVEEESSKARLIEERKETGIEKGYWVRTR